MSDPHQNTAVSHGHWRKVNLAATSLSGAGVLTAGLSIQQSAFPSFQALGGLFVVCLAAIVLTGFHFRHTHIGNITADVAGRIALLGAIAGVLGVQVMAKSFALKEPMGTGFLLTVPLLAQAMLTSAMIGPSLAVFVLTVTCFLLGLSGSLPIAMIAVVWIAGAVSAHAVNPIKHRNDLLRAMGIVGMANAVIATGATVMVVSTAMPVLSSAAWAALAAVLATSVFWMSVAVVERLFNIVSDWSLLELCSPDHPLMRELVLRAPGTYAHSVMVGNLAEGAAREIGANPTLCRALAYFHDVGKLTRPSHFIENQQGENVHDHLPARLSARIIMQHVADGMELAAKHRLPRILRNGIQQHHGTGLLHYFYLRALEVDPTSPETEFRYPGPRPQNREIAILHLADSVEAASRVVPRGHSEELEAVVNRIIEDRRSDGQLDESDLTFRDLGKIRNSFLRTLSALRHERIAYPDDPAHDAHLDLQALERPRE